MVPLKIQLKNFLSYGPILQTIDFGPYPLICLSGKNGHGKSALLDAITWSVWGQARKISGVAKSDNHLLRLGQTQMMVIFDFLFNGNHYRIRREYAKTYGKPYAALDFGIVDQNNHALSLTGKTIRETQAIIETTVGLDFDSFINSAFLRQGQSNEFSKKSPKDRKEILSSILGLNHYETMKKLALNKAKEATVQLQQLHHFNEKIEKELEKTGEISTKILEIEQKIAFTLEQDKQHIQQTKELEIIKQQYAQEKQREQLLYFQLQEKKAEQETSKTNLLSLYTSWKRIHVQQKNIYDVTQLASQKQELLNKIAHFQAKLQKNLELKTALLHFQQEEQTLNKQFQDTVAQHMRDYQNVLITLQTSISTKQAEESIIVKKQQTNKNALDELTKKLQNLASQQKVSISEQEKATLEKQFEKRKVMYHQWMAQGNLITKELANSQQKQLLQGNDQNTSCPVCEQNLSASRKKFLITKYKQEEQLLTHRLKRLSSITKQLKTVLCEQHAQLENIKKQDLEQTQHLISQQELLKNKHVLMQEESNNNDQLHTIQHELIQLKADHAQKNNEFHSIQESTLQTLKTSNAYTILQDTIKKTQEALEKTSYNLQEHQNCAQLLQEIENNYQQAHLHIQEVAQQKTRKEEMLTLFNSLRTLKNHIQEYTLKIKSYTYLEALSNTIQIKENTLTTGLQELQEQKEMLLLEKGRLENERTNLRALEKEHTRQKGEMNSLRQTINDYQVLATTFGKDGIQALLIEEALPEIEQEANTLLNQLTNNQSHIFIESLRDLQKGGTKETLDIKISDAQGIRPYELFSGGEAFRIDFALRIAISKLLARRSGTSLQTLIIDEGFGSQDEEGLSHIMDALHKIQDNFCKIIIVSHLTSMKDQFPVHFHIEKNAQGSTVQVIEQG